MTAGGLRIAAVFAIVGAAILVCPQARAQSCPAPLAQAKRLVLVTAASMNDVGATVRLYERASPAGAWHALGPAEPATVGRAGMAWSQFFPALARRGEPIKIEHDKRTPAGVFPIGRSFGILASSRPGYLHVTRDTVCVDDPSHPEYNTITSRGRIGPGVRVENMSQMLPMYRRGLLVEYPTDRGRRAGSCIFIHVWHSPTTGTAGCVALPEPRVEALQNFSAAGAILAVLPRAALGRLAGCLPQN